MSLQADSAANGGGDVPPQIIGDVASESGQLPDVGDTQDAVPEDFWKPVETTPCASASCRSNFGLILHALLLHVLCYYCHCCFQTANLVDGISLPCI